jgi:hypothetical protein
MALNTGLPSEIDATQIGRCDLYPRFIVRMQGVVTAMSTDSVKHFRTDNELAW